MLCGAQPYGVNVGIEVTGDDVAVATWVEAWIGGMRLAPTLPVTLELRVVRAPPREERDERAPFLQPEVEIRTGPPRNDVTVRWLAGRASATIPEGEARARVELAPDAAADCGRLAQTFLPTVLILLLRRAGWHHVHAALARDPQGRGWLLAGNAGSGKSTTAALLATWGWGVGSDDLTFLARSGLAVEAIASRAPIALRPDAFKLLGVSTGAVVRGGRKTGFFPEELGGTWEPRVEPSVLVFPRVVGERTAMVPLRRRDALAELVRWSAWVALDPVVAQEHLDLLGALAGQARSFRLGLARDVTRRRDLLMELVP